ncbi:hypothetical protein IMG5_067920 [Ichthyophthirius multifiliis]|uniref:CR-type domain-containing protein n=1 Tax=Ichthyophthirius multifiliis TaxID=5932 RepID=G0QPH3_ICHMU|nr:hypothetical protein IMG5_067920 [Ichthyophthirius multifiliis]EGR32886.1 hypothetical protein IMG5_067920 [Ichthyophthirius multifiliis]|eukprot:XP_004036872.1 hypothetical protein IMG5_067920 [Ichthyophthirius multifiliis]
MEGLENEKNKPQDLFDILTGGNTRGKQRNRGIQKMRGVKMYLEVSLEESYIGKVLKMPFERQKNCHVCDGKGGSEIKQCYTCKGRGIQIKTINMGPIIQQFQQDCQSCGGEGKIINEKNKCQSCKGNKIYNQKVILDVPINKGAYDGQEIILYGEGDEAPGYMAGDLHLTVKMKHNNVFQRQGADLIMKKKINLAESLTGFSFVIKTLDNNEVIISNNKSEVIYDEMKKIVKGLGMPYFGDHMSYGNLIIIFQVEFPQNGALSTYQLNKLSEILPGPTNKQPNIPKDDVLILEEFDPHTTNPNEEGGKKEYEEEEEEDEYCDYDDQDNRPQCAQQ